MAKMGLSKNLLQMKFMQRRKKDEHPKIEESYTSSKEWELRNNNGRHFIVEPSFVNCEDLVFGRMSFKGQNPEIEKIMKELTTKKEEILIEDKVTIEESVSAEEMAYRYSTLIGSIGKKFSTKRQRRQGQDKSTPLEEPGLSPDHKRQKFMKPKN